MIERKHIEVLLASSILSQMIINLLPQTDLIDNLDDLVSIQAEICKQLYNNRLFGDNDLEEMVEFIDNLEMQIEILMKNSG